jgi:flagellar biosynthesis protein FliQ
MTEGYLLTLANQTLFVVLQLAGPLLGFSLIVGVMVSIFQAVTQIQDMTLSFVPKILSVVLAFLIFGPWMLRVIISFTQGLILNLPAMVR